MSDFYNKYPYTGFHELNLDWVIGEMKKLNESFAEFSSINEIKFADPMEWSVLAEYAIHTVVFR